METPELIATIFGGLCWIIVYVCMILIGFRQKTYCMPIFPLCMNLIWELSESIEMWGYIREYGWDVNLSVSFIVFTIWFVLDVVIFVTYCMYGRKYLPTAAQPYFIQWTVLVFLICWGICWMINMTQGDYATNCLSWIEEMMMAILLPVMLFQRGSTEGQSLWIAALKLVGSEFWAYIELVYYWQYAGYWVLVCSIMVFFLDIVYIYFLYKFSHTEKKTIKRYLYK